MANMRDPDIRDPYDEFPNTNPRTAYDHIDNRRRAAPWEWIAGGIALAVLVLILAFGTGSGDKTATATSPSSTSQSTVPGPASPGAAPAENTGSSTAVPPAQNRMRGAPAEPRP